MARPTLALMQHTYTYNCNFCRDYLLLIVSIALRRVRSTEVMMFQHMLVRLFSVLHAVALAEIEDCESDDPSH
eukprot:895138-Amphidinium_carterae.1